jgi:hypothetical protein
MADTQNVVYGQAYSRNIMQLAQEKYAKLLPIVYRKDNVTGKNFYQDQIGKWSMQAKGGRNVQTPNNDPNLGRRMGSLVDYHDNRMLVVMNFVRFLILALLTPLQQRLLWVGQSIQSLPTGF